MILLIIVSLVLATIIFADCMTPSDWDDEAEKHFSNHLKF
jgi:hypothetical protein